MASSATVFRILATSSSRMQLIMRVGSGLVIRCGNGVPRMGSAEASSMTISEDNWRQPSLQSGARPWTRTTRPRRPEPRDGSTFCAATGPGCFDPSLSPSSWGTTMEGTSMRVNNGSLTASWPGSSMGAAHLPRLELGRHYARILPDVQRRQWLGLLERYDQGGDADSTSGCSSSDSAADKV